MVSYHISMHFRSHNTQNWGSVAIRSAWMRDHLYRVRRISLVRLCTEPGLPIRTVSLRHYARRRSKIPNTQPYAPNRVYLPGPAVCSPAALRHRFQVLFWNHRDTAWQKKKISAPRTIFNKDWLISLWSKVVGAICWYITNMAIIKAWLHWISCREQLGDMESKPEY